MKIFALLLLPMLAQAALEEDSIPLVDMSVQRAALEEDGPSSIHTSVNPYGMDSPPPYESLLHPPSPAQPDVRVRPGALRRKEDKRYLTIATIVGTFITIVFAIFGYFVTSQGVVRISQTLLLALPTFYSFH